MRIKKDNAITIARRIRELLVDYAVIFGYLALLFLLFSLLYNFVLAGIPEFTRLQAHLISLFTTVIPVIIIFSILDYKKPYGSYGKRSAKLKVHYKQHSFSSSLIRNCVKFLPWQLGHMGTVEGVFTAHENFYAIGFTILSFLLAGIMLWMGLFRKDKRHLGDLLAGTQVVLRDL